MFFRRGVPLVLVRIREIVTKFSCCALNFLGMDLEDSIRLVRGLGFIYAEIEIVSSKAQVNQLETADKPDEFGLYLRNLANEIGIALVEFFVVAPEVDGHGIHPNHPDKHLRDHALRLFHNLCHCAKVSSCHSIMLVPGSPPKEGTRERIGSVCSHTAQDDNGGNRSGTTSSR